ncbi:sodium/potassium/calcium exchanger 4-like [Trichogramma pretiosum]|uniref:sodium/potassium/calcium exchanger 4-like n=1 Tax=Trichogramma pretiosum TaxID=7493 RepID=UPI0006C9673A|nr:sodium/potassium/calcium exchanger 4-like [Trichogramma pretiosum]
MQGLVKKPSACMRLTRFVFLFVLLVVKAHINGGHSLPLSNDAIGTKPLLFDNASSTTLLPSNATDDGDSLLDFPEDIFTEYQLQHGAILLHLFFGIYCFILTGFVCNDYLLPTIDLICIRLKISTDVAGATFLAAASSFPEFFITLIGTFLTKNDLGVGTVVGSAVFNTFATPAVGAIFAMQAIPLQWKILSRDCLIYGASVGALVYVMWDGEISKWESLFLVLAFLTYFVILLNEKRIIKRCKAIRRAWKVSPHKGSSSNSVQIQPAPERELVAENYTMPFGTYTPNFHPDLITEYNNHMNKLKAAVNAEAANANGGQTPVEKQQPPVQHQDEEDSVPESIFVWPSDKPPISKFWFLFVWPIKFLLLCTIPDIRYKSRRQWYPLSFIMCTAWIAISSYLASWMTTVVGTTIFIPDSVMGLTFLAAGGNLPEMVSIVLLSRQGQGDMAMSNIFGANTLDILLCLGVPWSIQTFMANEPIVIASKALVYSNLTIIFCLLGFYLATFYWKFVLNRKVGFTCLLMYGIFLVFAIYMEIR